MDVRIETNYDLTENTIAGETIPIDPTLLAACHITQARFLR